LISANTEGREGGVAQGGLKLIAPRSLDRISRYGSSLFPPRTACRGGVILWLDQGIEATNTGTRVGWPVPAAQAARGGKRPPVSRRTGQLTQPVPLPRDQVTRGLAPIDGAASRNLRSRGPRG